MLSFAKNILPVIFAALLFNTVNAQGKFAGAHRSLIGKTFTDEKYIPALKDYTFAEGTLLTKIDDPQQVLSSLYKKGNTYIFLLTSLTDTISKIYKIEDVLEVKNVQASWQLKSSTCRVNEKEDDMIIALVKTGNTAYFKKVKQAWKIDLAKKIINASGIKGIDCINEGFGE